MITHHQAQAMLRWNAHVDDCCLCGAEPEIGDSDTVPFAGHEIGWLCWTCVQSYGPFMDQEGWDSVELAKHLADEGAPSRDGEGEFDETGGELSAIYDEFLIYFDKRAPRPLQWKWIHKEYDGPGDRRIGSEASPRDCFDRIDEWLASSDDDDDDDDRPYDDGEAADIAYRDAMRDAGRGGQVR